MEHPTCFAARLYKKWQDASRIAHEPDASVCDDCLPSYQLAMKRAGRCANPNAIFKFNPDGTIVGIGAPQDKPEPSEKPVAKVRAVRRTAPTTGLRIGRVETAPTQDFWADRHRRIHELLNR